MDIFTIEECVLNVSNINIRDIIPANFVDIRYTILKKEKKKEKRTLTYAHA